MASPTPYTSRGSRQWRNPPAEAGLRTLSTTNIGGDRGLVAWSEEQFGAEPSLTVYNSWRSTLTGVGGRSHKALWSHANCCLKCFLGSTIAL